jgi:hypothetical protein
MVRVVALGLLASMQAHGAERRECTTNIQQERLGQRMFYQFVPNDAAHAVSVELATNAPLSDRPNQPQLLMQASPVSAQSRAPIASANARLCLMDAVPFEYVLRSETTSKAEPRFCINTLLCVHLNSKMFRSTLS